MERGEMGEGIDEKRIKMNIIIMYCKQTCKIKNEESGM